MSTYRRMIYATGVAVGAFRAAWDRFDADEEAAQRYAERQIARERALQESFATLSESDKHFLNMFVNNLTNDKPARTDLERFAGILEQLPEDARVHVLRKATAVCPMLLCTGVVAKLVRALDVGAGFERAK